MWFIIGRTADLASQAKAGQSTPDSGTTMYTTSVRILGHFNAD